MIPPCGVPLVGCTIFPSGIRIGARRICRKTWSKALSLIPIAQICLINLGWFTL